MSVDNPLPSPLHPFWRILRRKNVLSGLMFIAFAALGLWTSRNYPIGTALRMSTGYVPRLLCWILLGLGAVILLQGLRETESPEHLREPVPGDSALARLRPVGVVTLALVTFGLSLETLGLALAILLLTVIASFATRELKLWETLAAAAGLTVLTWVIFVLGLGLPIPLWPDW